MDVRKHIITQNLSHKACLQATRSSRPNHPGNTGYILEKQMSIAPKYTTRGGILSLGAGNEGLLPVLLSPSLVVITVLK